MSGAWVCGISATASSVVHEAIPKSNMNAEKNSSFFILNDLKVGQ
jgi:hypothetical protein